MLNNLLNYAKDENIALEVYLTKNDELSIEYQNEKLINYKLQDIEEYKIKALIDGVAITSTTLDISNPQEVIKNLKDARTLTDELDQDSLAAQIYIEKQNRCDIEIDPIEIKNNILELNKEVKERYPEVFSIRTEYNFEKDEYNIVNTNNVDIKDCNYHGYYLSDIVLKIGDKNVSCNKFEMAKVPDFNTFKNKVISTIEDTIKRVDAKSTITKKYNIILDNKCVNDILKTFILDFHAANIIKNQSAFSDKLNKQIFSDKITIVEDPTNEELIGTRLFDGEGIKTSFKKIVENGVFKTKLYNKKYAAKDNTESTGNSFGVKNAYIIPGYKTQEELIIDLNEGILIDELKGLHSGVNHLTGDISLQCEGFEIKDGKKTKGLKLIILSTNVFELFNNVKEIADDLEFFGEASGAPSILFENITIAGKEV